MKSLLITALAVLAFTPVSQAKVHLLVDDHDVASSHGLTRTVQSPAKRRGPILTAERFHTVSPFVSVYREGDTWRMWYGIGGREARQQLAHTTSTDGIHWNGWQAIEDPAGEILQPNDVFRTPNGYGFAWWHDGMRIATSRDGIDFGVGDRDLMLPEAQDIIEVYRDGGRYVSLYKLWSSTGRRVVGRSYSPDLITWTPPKVIIGTDGWPDGTQFYGIGGVVRRGDTQIGLLRVLRDDRADGVGWTTLVWSHDDGRTWTADREPFLRRGPVGTWDHAMAWGSEQAIVGDETYVYYGGYDAGHKLNRYTGRQIGLARMPLDRYVARAGTGALTMRPMRFERFRLNARVRGALRIDFLRGGHVVSSCDVARGDYVYRRVCGRVSGRLSVRFRLERGALYGVAG